MGTWIRRLCVLAIFCGAAQSMAPEGSGKRALRFVCAVVLLTCALGGLRDLDPDALWELSGDYDAREEELASHAETIREESERAVIARSYAAYIWDKAEELGLELEEVQVELTQRSDGLCVPKRVEIRSGETEEALAPLRAAIDRAFASPELLWERRDDGPAG